MTVELACRLLENRALPRIEVAAALLDASLRGVAFVQALMDRLPAAANLIDAEHARWSGPTETNLSVDVRMVESLPAGMCERLLALPLRRRDPLQPIPLAVVDPFDQHVRSEFEFCLGIAVTPVRVTYVAFIQALQSKDDPIVDRAGQPSSNQLDALLDMAEEDDTPAFGTRLMRVIRKPAAERVRRTTADMLSPHSRRGYTLPSVEAPEPISEVAIPLVRTTLKPDGHGWGRGSRAAPPAIESGHADLEPLAIPSVGQDPSRDEVEAASRVQRDSEPVLRLVKQKPSIQIRRVSVPPPRFSEHSWSSPEEMLAAIDQAKSPRHLIELLREALQVMAPCQAYFSVRAGRYTLEWASGIEPSDVGSARLTVEQQVVLGKACQTGYFLGPLPPDGDTPALGATLGLRAREEIYMAPVQVVQRPALLIVVGRFDEAFAVTRWVDAVVARAGLVLERLARNRK